MTNDTERLHIDGPCSDWHTRNLILQVTDWEHGISEAEEDDRRERVGYALRYLLQLQEIPQDAADQTKLLQELLEKKGKAFQHTSEYYAAIEDERERMKAYRDLKVVSTVPYGEDAEIAANPYKFLYLPEDATFAQIRDAWIRLSKKWHPDIIRPENGEQYNRIFGSTDPFPIDGTDYVSWVGKLLESEPPTTLTTEQLDTLSPDQRESYLQKKETYKKKEDEYEKVKTEMRRRATEKQTILNKAYEAAKKRFSDKEIQSFAGFAWEKESHSGVNGRFHDDYDVLKLEGSAQLQKYKGYWIFEPGMYHASDDNDVYLAYDFGSVQLADQDEYRQELYLRSFFAWTELRLGQGLCPTLLDDVTKTYKLDDTQAEQLRLMILNQEKPEFILAAFKISPDNVGEMLFFLNDVYEGPTYEEEVGWDSYRSHPLGVEFTPEGGLILTYGFETLQLTPLDVQMMRAVAYGPLLQEPDPESQ